MRDSLVLFVTFFTPRETCWVVWQLRKSFILFLRANAARRLPGRPQTREIRFAYSRRML